MATATYTARIELQGGSPLAYQALHDRMAAAGFHRGENEVVIGVPQHAEYFCESEKDLDGVFEAARAAGAAGAMAFTIMVCESRTRKWIGLRVSKPA